MRAYDLIMKKRNGGQLTGMEIRYLVSGYAQGRIADYQMAAFCMAVYFRGMSSAEMLDLTMAMIESGDLISWQEIPGTKVDKHSTGGVGDTTTLVLAPLVAAAGVPVAKMSGRGLGHTGGTIDKLEAIPGLKTELSIEETIRAVKKIGVAIVSQTANLVPADKKLYALRDVTATVDSLPLIASSIMSKKLAAGADALLLDVKTGDGALLPGLTEARALAEAMVAIGRGAGRKAAAVITNMDQPLGRAVGAALEVKEAIETLKGEGPPDLEELCLVLGGLMLQLAGAAACAGEGSLILRKLILSGKAADKFKELIASQHGNSAVADDFSLLPRAPLLLSVNALSTGFIHRIRAAQIGRAASLLGAGRETKDSLIDPAAGILLNKKVGEEVEAGEVLAVLHTGLEDDHPAVEAARQLVLAACEIKAAPSLPPPLILEYIK